MRGGVDVIVVNHRTPDDLDRFLTSLTKYMPRAVPVSLWIGNVAPQPMDLIVVERWQTHMPVTSVHWVWGDNCGYGRAVNRLATMGDRQVIAAFNADVSLTDGSLDACVGALLARDDWGILGPRQVNDEGLVVHAGIFGDNEPRGWRAGGGYEDLRDDCSSVSGSAYFVKRSVWEQLSACRIAPCGEGAFLESPLFYEETWCSAHAIAHGHKVAYFGDVTVGHRWHGSIKANRVNGTRLAKESKVMFDALCESHGISR